MCTCQNQIGNSATVADFFKANIVPVSRVFAKYGMDKVEPTPDWAVVGAIAHGVPFAQEVSQAAAGAAPEMSSATGLTEQQQATGGAIMGWITDAIKSGTTIANTVIAGKAQQAGQPVVFQQPSFQGAYGLPGQTYPSYYPPVPGQPTTTGGFTTGQILVMAGIGLAFIAAVVFILVNKKQG